LPHHLQKRNHISKERGKGEGGGGGAKKKGERRRRGRRGRGRGGGGGGEREKERKRERERDRQRERELHGHFVTVSPAHGNETIHSLLHLECHLILISNLNLIGLFSAERGKKDLEN